MPGTPQPVLDFKQLAYEEDLQSCAIIKMRVSSRSVWRQLKPDHDVIRKVNVDDLIFHGSSPLGPLISKRTSQLCCVVKKRRTYARVVIVAGPGVGEYRDVRWIMLWRICHEGVVLTSAHERIIHDAKEKLRLELKSKRAATRARKSGSAWKHNNKYSRGGNNFLEE